MRITVLAAVTVLAAIVVIALILKALSEGDNRTNPE